MSKDLKKILVRIKCECGALYYSTAHRNRLGQVHFYLATYCPQCGIKANYIDGKSDIELHLVNDKNKQGEQ